METSSSLWQGRKFTPLWISQFLSALNDNLFRYAFNTALIFGVIDIAESEAKFWVSLSAAFFILPYLLFSGLAGQLADKFPKAKLLRINRLIEIFVFGIGSYGLAIGNVALLLASLLLTGTAAAFYGPVKYAITPELVGARQLLGANGAIETGVYAAILFGTLAGTSLIVFGSIGPELTIAVMLIIAIAAWCTSLLTPNVPAAAPQLKINWNIPAQIMELIRWGYEDKTRIRLLLGHAWFWFVGAAVLSQLTIFVKEDLHSVPELNTLFLALFALGIGIGGWLCNHLLRGQISPQYVSLSALGISFWSLMLAGIAYANPPTEHILTLGEFLSLPWGWLMMLSVIMLAACAGLYVVPLVSMMQVSIGDGQRARMLSLANIWFAIFVIGSSILSAAIIGIGGQPKTVFAVIGVMTLGVAVYTLFLLPRTALKGIFAALLRIFYRVEVIGAENLASLGPRAVIVANHQSYLDGILLAAFLPGNPVFAIDPVAASRWWAKPVVSLVDIFTINPAQPMQVRNLIHVVQSGRQCVIFPEGRLTETGSLMKINAGPALIAEKSDAPLVPVRLEGPQYSPFGYMRGVLPIRLFPKITLHILPPVMPKSTAELGGKKRRQTMARNLYDLMADMIFSTQPPADNLWDALQRAANKYGHDKKILEDARRQPMRYGRLLTGAVALGSALKKYTNEKEHVGMLLPTGIGGIVTFFALQSTRRIPAMLNYTAGRAAMLAALTAAEIKTVITAREFVEKGKLEPLIEIIHEKARVIYLEDIRKEITLFDKLSAMLRANSVKSHAKPNDTAVVLFTSGSEGLPKGVVLSHRNLITNVEQIRTIVPYTPRDVVFNALPIFHAFGLTGATLVPLLHGTKTFVHPTPLHYRIIPELIYQSNTTIVFGTDTFLSGYAKTADNYDFYNVRMIFAGAEKLRPETLNLYAQKFGAPVYEGYGVTECSPVLAVNTPMHNQPGTVGRLLPQVEYKLEEVPGITNGARLYVRGQNIMRGYLRAEQPGVLQPLDDGWYDTGDIVNINNAGFITIMGRAKRFAKIGGEMISLAAIEQYAVQLWPDAQHAAISVPDARKGEAIILATTEPAATLPELTAFMKSHGASELGIPKQLQVMDAIPLLGTGKTDYVTLKNMLSSE